MLRSAVSKVMWVGRATVFLVGLAVILALVFAAANSALAHTSVDNKLFHLNHNNNVTTALTKLTGTLSGAVLKLDNNGTGPALSLQVEPNRAPLSVNASAGTATGLSADELDGRDSTTFANATHPHAGEDITSGTVEADRIEDGPDSGLNADQLDGVDSTQFAQKLDSGMITLDPTSIAAQTCGHLVIDPPGAGDISNDVVVVTPDSVAASTNLVFGASRASQNPNAFRIRMCNITTSAIDPPSATYYWMIFHQP